MVTKCRTQEQLEQHVANLEQDLGQHVRALAFANHRIGEHEKELRTLRAALKREKERYENC